MYLNKIILSLFLIFIFVGIVSAGWFDWLIKPKPEPIPYKPAFNISNDFTIKKQVLNKEPICDKRSIFLHPVNTKMGFIATDNFCSFKMSNPKEIDLSNSNYFNTNSQGVIRFKNE